MLAGLTSRKELEQEKKSTSPLRREGATKIHLVVLMTSQVVDSVERGRA